MIPLCTRLVYKLRKQSKEAWSGCAYVLDYAISRAILADAVHLLDTRR
jgi:hypothetical protein